jgi:hypothetical protein
MDKKPQHEAKLTVKFAVSYIHFLQALANPKLMYSKLMHLGRSHSLSFPVAKHPLTAQPQLIFINLVIELAIQVLAKQRSSNGR